MSIKVRIPSPLRNFTQGADTVVTTGTSVAEVLEDLKTKAAGIETRLFKAPAQLNRFVNIYLNDDKWGTFVLRYTGKVPEKEPSKSAAK